jgi:DNA-binding HxlR family transcriptional regulator
MPPFHMKALSHPRAIRVGRVLLSRPTRFTDLLKLDKYTETLTRVLRKMLADDLVERNGEGVYQLIARGVGWVKAGVPLPEWLDANRAAIEAAREHRGQRRPIGNDPVLPA